MTRFAGNLAKHVRTHTGWSATVYQFFSINCIHITADLSPPPPFVPGRRALRSACRGDLLDPRVLTKFCWKSQLHLRRAECMECTTVYLLRFVTVRFHCHVFNPRLRPISFTAHNVVVTHVRL